MLIDIQPHLIFVFYLFPVTSQSLLLSRDSQRGAVGPPAIVTSRAASIHRNLQVKSPEQTCRVTLLMSVGWELK